MYLQLSSYRQYLKNKEKTQEDKKLTKSRKTEYPIGKINRLSKNRIRKLKQQRFDIQLKQWKYYYIEQLYEHLKKTSHQHTFEALSREDTARGRLPLMAHH